MYSLIFIFASIMRRGSSKFPYSCKISYSYCDILGVTIQNFASFFSSFFLYYFTLFIEAELIQNVTVPALQMCEFTAFLFTGFYLLGVVAVNWCHFEQNIFSQTIVHVEGYKGSIELLYAINQVCEGHSNVGYLPAATAWHFRLSRALCVSWWRHNQSQQSRTSLQLIHSLCFLLPLSISGASTHTLPTQ